MDNMSFNVGSEAPLCCRGKVLYLYLSQQFALNDKNIYRRTCWMRLKCRNFMVKYGIRTGFPRLVARGTVRIHTRPRHPRVRIGPALSLSGSILRRAAGYCVFSHHGHCFLLIRQLFSVTIGLSTKSLTQLDENKRFSKNRQLGCFRYRLFVFHKNASIFA